MRKDVALKMVEQAFEYAVKIKDIDTDTAKTYFGRVQNFINNHLNEKAESDEKKARNAYHPGFWKGGWVDEWFEKLIARHEGKDPNLKPVGENYIVNTVYAFAKLQDMVNNHGIWKNAGIDKVRVGVKGSIKSEEGRLYELYKRDIGQSQDEVTSMKGSPEDYKKMMGALRDVMTLHDRNGNPRKDENGNVLYNRNYETVKNLLESQYITGGRITAEINLKAGDINFDKWTKYYDKDKNNFSRTVPVPKNELGMYRNLCKDKDAGSPLFPIIKKDGKQMDKRAASRYVQSIVRKCSEKAGLTGVDEKGKKTRYTPHTSRRVYGQRLYNSTRFTKEKKIDEMIQKYIDLQGSNKEKILARIEAEKDRLNWENIKNGKGRKPLSWEQKRRLLVSLHLGHSRISVISRYIDYDKPISKQRKKKK